MKVKLPQVPKSPLAFWSIVLGIPFAFIAVVIFMFLYQGSSKEIVAVADKFDPGEGWVLESESVTPPQIICYGGTCPEVVRKWKLKGSVDSTNLKAIMNSLKNFQSSSTENCALEEIKSENLCNIQLYQNGYSIQVYLDNSNTIDKTNSKIIAFTRER
jgi:hypothetical protein